MPRGGAFASAPVGAPGGGGLPLGGGRGWTVRDPRSLRSWGTSPDGGGFLFVVRLLASVAPASRFEGGSPGGGPGGRFPPPARPLLPLGFFWLKAPKSGGGAPPGREGGLRLIMMDATLIHSRSGRKTWSSSVHRVSASASVLQTVNVGLSLTPTTSFLLVVRSGSVVSFFLAFLSSRRAS